MPQGRDLSSQNVVIRRNTSIGNEISDNVFNIN
jgi:hypothetical protein